MTTATKPIRPTKGSFGSPSENKKFDDYISQKKSDSFDMNRIRDMVSKHQDKRK